MKKKRMSGDLFSSSTCSTLLYSSLQLDRVSSTRRNALDLFFISTRPFIPVNETRLDGKTKFVHAKTLPLLFYSFIIHIRVSFIGTCDLFSMSISSNPLNIHILWIFHRLSLSLPPNEGRIFLSKSNDENDDDNKNGNSHLTKKKPRTQISFPITFLSH